MYLAVHVHKFGVTCFRPPLPTAPKQVTAHTLVQSVAFTPALGSSLKGAITLWRGTTV